MQDGLCRLSQVVQTGVAAEGLGQAPEIKEKSFFKKPCVIKLISILKETLQKILFSNFMLNWTYFTTIHLNSLLLCQDDMRKQKNKFLKKSPKEPSKRSTYTNAYTRFPSPDRPEFSPPDLFRDAIRLFFDRPRHPAVQSLGEGPQGLGQGVGDGPQDLRQRRKVTKSRKK